MTAKTMPSEALWQQYAFYNREMVKFIRKDDIDMFLTLRDLLISAYEKIERAPRDGYTDTAAGKALVAEMQTNLRFLQLAVQRWLNDARHKQSVSDAYGTLDSADSGALRSWLS